ncbi:LysR family transcriptional regulator [Vibrio profundum]|uniref:LysR family transcriptional regulator n=1 Tax=Vibrio profundum TaxID=2910247 RepID=UPI003D103170
MQFFAGDECKSAIAGKSTGKRKMNWDDVRVFLAVARAGSLKGAAQSLMIDQTTAGRRLKALEEKLNCSLFLRTSNQLKLSKKGQEVVALAQAMEERAVSFERLCDGEKDVASGEVRVTTTDSLALDFIVPAISQIQKIYPQLRIVLSTTTQIMSLANREADIAIRTTRPHQLDLITRQLACWEVGLYASKSYLDRKGSPHVDEKFAGHEIAIYQAGVSPQQSETLVEVDRSKANVVAELNSSLMLFNFVKAGLALAELPSYMAEREPELVRVWPEKARSQPYQVWLALHADSAHAARTRIVVDAIAAQFQCG